MIRIVIGTEANQFTAQKVLEYSIRKHTKEPVEIRFVTQQAGMRVGGTNFGFVRFMIPSIYNFEGKAIYMDADQLVFQDVKGLWDSLPSNCDVACVQHPEGNFGDKPVGQHNQTSVMVMNCGRLRDWDPTVMFKTVVPNSSELKPGEIHYRDFMMLGFMDQSRIGALDPRWNHFNIIRDDTRLVHFSHVRSQPWKSPKHPLTPAWEGWLRETMRAGKLSRLELLREIVTGHVARHFLGSVISTGRERNAA